MKLSDKYISTKENTTKPDATKTVLSDDAFSILEGLEVLKIAVNQLSITIRGKK